MGLAAPVRAASADLLQRYQALLKTSDVILCCRNLDELFHQLAESLRNIVAFDGMAVGLLDEEGTSLKIGLLESFVPQTVDVGFSVPLDGVPGAWVIKHQQPMMWTAEDGDSTYKLHHDVLLASGLKASYHLPLSVQEDEVLSNFLTRTRREHIEVLPVLAADGSRRVVGVLSPLDIFLHEVDRAREAYKKAMLSATASKAS